MQHRCQISAPGLGWHRLILSVVTSYAYAYDRRMPTELLPDLPDVRPFHRVAVMNPISLLDFVRPADLDAPTPCAGWKLIDLLAHMTIQHRGFAAAARGFGSDPEVWRDDAGVDAAIAEPGGTCAEAVKDLPTAFAHAAVLEAGFALPALGPDAIFPG